MLFTIFLILDLLIILASVPLLLTGSARWARLAVLFPLGFGILSLIIGLIGHATQFPAWRLILVLIFAAAITAFICLLTARILLSIGPKPPAPPQQQSAPSEDAP